MPTPQRPSAQKDRNRVSGCLSHISVLISCPSSHVSSFRHSSHLNHLMSRSHVTHLMSQSHVSSHVTHLMSHHYVTHLMSHHYVTDTKLVPIYSRVATFNFCPWSLPTCHRIILPVTSTHSLRSNLCPPRSILLPKKIVIGFQSVSHSFNSWSHVTHLISHHYVTHPGLKGWEKG